MNARDNAIAEETISRSSLQCGARGCPSRWSVDAGSGRLCSAHAWVERRDWPRITQELIDDQVRRAVEAQNPQPELPTWTRGQKLNLLQGLREAMAKLQEAALDSKAWARRLRWREARGDRLTPFKREAWRNALRVPKGEPAAVSASAHEPEA